MIGFDDKEMPAVTQNADSRPNSAKIDVGQRPVSISSLRRHDNDVQVTVIDPKPDDGRPTTTLFLAIRPLVSVSIVEGWRTRKGPVFIPSLLANSSVERCRTDGLMPNVPISCLTPSRVDPEVQGLGIGKTSLLNKD